MTVIGWGWFPPVNQTIWPTKPQSAARITTMSEVTRILTAIEQGDSRAAEELLPLVYEELRLLARQKMAQEKPGQTLQATALVHEAYLRLIGSENQPWENTKHFLCAAAEAMRRILIESARRKQRFKHGGEMKRINIDEAELPLQMPSEELLALNEALQSLAQVEKSGSALDLTLNKIHVPFKSWRGSVESVNC